MPSLREPDGPVVTYEVPPGQPAPLAYYVTAPGSMKSIFGPAGAGACIAWARREAAASAMALDVRESGTGAVFFGFDDKGVFCS